MTREVITLEKVTASEGMMLTNGEITAEVVYLGTADTIENWTEVEKEE